MGDITDPNPQELAQLSTYGQEDAKNNSKIENAVARDGTHGLTVAPFALHPRNQLHSGLSFSHLPSPVC